VALPGACGTARRISFFPVEASCASSVIAGIWLQYPRSIELALIEGAGRARQLHRPADLAFDLLDELPDLAAAASAYSRWMRMSETLLISETDLNQAVYEEHGEDHREKQRHVPCGRATWRQPLSCTDSQNVFE
jgi:hypothetical protein